MYRTRKSFYNDGFIMALDSEVPFRPSEAMFRRQETLLKLAVDSIQEAPVKLAVDSIQEAPVKLAVDSIEEAPRDEQVLSGRLSEESGCCCSIS
jgi:hypothetical protein